MTFGGKASLLASRFSALWRSQSDTFAPFGKTFSLQQMQRLKTSVRDLVVKSMDPGDREQTGEMLKQFSDSGDEFVHEARKFDPDLKPEEIFQTLRNVWIINSMQVALGLPVRLNRSGLAYSLLYPYTDNCLDAPAASEREKKGFNRDLARRLAGFTVPAPSQHTAKVFHLVEMIESEYPRRSFPGVYESLLAIHRAQENTLQQRDSGQCCAPSAILRISVEKGGSSVLADAYVAKGWPTPQEADFAFGYGVFLQFIDDLQDVGEDVRSGSRTLFTIAAGEGALDGMANRLVRFTKKVLASSDLLSLPRAAALSELVRRSCCSLILESIALNSGMYSSAYVEAVEQHSAVRFDCIRRLHREVGAKQTRLRRVFKGRRPAHLAAACA